MKLDYTRHARARMFENDFLEFASNIHPAVPFVVYVPVVVGLLAWGLVQGLTSWGALAVCFPLGWVTWGPRRVWHPPLVVPLGRQRAIHPEVPRHHPRLPPQVSG